MRGIRAEFYFFFDWFRVPLDLTGDFVISCELEIFSKKESSNFIHQFLFWNCIDALSQ